jgi:hypothetical protein
MNKFKKATKKQAKLRLALFGVSGSGKTYSALRIAKGLGGNIAVIDTENHTACKYSDRFDFDVCECEKASINNLMTLLSDASEYDVLIIDSLTHAWDELLDEVNRIAKTKFGGNSWSAWSEGTPKQRAFIKALLDFKGHLIVTMRSETTWEVQENDKGKKVPVRIGTAPKQGKSIEYEFDMLINLSQDHTAHILKDRTGKYQDECLELLDENLGKELGEWLSVGEVVKKEQALTNNDVEIFKQMAEINDIKELANFYKANYNLVSDVEAFVALKDQRKEVLNGSNN